jgi:hypothetical protein
MATNKSKVWKYFKIDNVDTTKVVCNECNAKISRGGTTAKNFTTTNMISHLRSQHTVLYHEFELNKSKKSAVAMPNSISIKGSTSSSTVGECVVQPTLAQCNSMAEAWPTDHPRAKSISTAIGAMMALDCQPFSIVEDEGFKRLMKLVAPKYALPSRKYFSSTLLTEMYDHLRVNVGKALVPPSCEFIALTTDEWSADSAPGVALLSLTAHWIDEKFNRCHAMLHAQNLEEGHTGDYLGKVLTDMLADWNLLKNRVQYVLRDNAAAMIKAMRVADLPHTGCMAHTLQLAVKDALESQKGVENVIALGRRIVGHFKHSTLAYNRLVEFQKVHKLPEHRLIQDEPTRWNSTFYMLVRLREQRLALTSYGGQYDVNLPTVSQWELIDKAIVALQPIEDVTQVNEFIFIAMIVSLQHIIK